MELFSEVYGIYYQIVSKILERAHSEEISRQEIMDITEHLGFEESVLTVPDKLCSGEWNFLEKSEAGTYTSRLENVPQFPFTLLQKRWIKSLLSDSRVRLFFDDDALSEISEALSAVEPLWDETQFLYYDRYEDGDDYSSEEYRQSFRLVMDAIRKGKTINFAYTSAKGKYAQKTCLPLKIEYSPKNDRFRLIAYRGPFGNRLIMERYRLDGMRNVTLLEPSQNDIVDTIDKASDNSTVNTAAEALANATDNTIIQAASISLDAHMRESYGTEPVRLIIQNKRNALERAMLHFANYDKDTKQLDENTWECCIYYDSSMETELLIEILSFGPVVKVVSPDTFVAQIRERLKKQLELM